MNIRPRSSRELEARWSSTASAGNGSSHRAARQTRQPSAELAQRARTVLLDTVTAEVTTALNSRGIRSIVLKGPALADWLYADGTLRSYNDTDLLVAPADVTRTEASLRELGFSNLLGPLAHPRISAQQWDRSGQHVDLHSTLWGLGERPEQVWQTLSSMTEPMRVAGVEVQVLTEAPRALHVALHAAQHGEFAKKSLEDLERAVAQLPSEVWSHATALAHHLDGDAAFATGLRLSPVGEKIANSLGLGAVRSVEAELRVAPVSLAQGLDQLARTPGIGSKLKLILQEIAPTPAFMRWWSPLARRGPFGLALAYAWRPIWLVLHAPSGVWAWRRAQRDALSGLRRP